ncbi:dihydroorotase [Vulcanimicrobium alpinum]|uniref:Dihydroorotase n=1 Tax=Vulcanimicrobium alpinum TaxID=3016050 RepID=A0AAN2C9Z9_UNVUL|nr:dihydroorotase [Vulcanimicrobium alpinum]BDE06566.1 dihydroorotase [Vulcanimicrobium alpinum]
MKTLIRGGRVIDPLQGIDANRDVLIENGFVTQIGEHLDAAGVRVVDASNAFVAPGFIDMHVHLREPGQTHKETIATGTAAAVAGGFTAVACMPNTEPALDSAAIVSEVVRRADAAGLARVYPVGAITRGRAGAELAPYHLLADAACVAFSDDGSTPRDARVLRNAARYAADLAHCFISHCEDADLKGDAVMNEGEASMRLGLDGSPGLAEDVIVARDLLIAQDTGKAWHIAHVSTANSLELIRWARGRGVRVTCEVTPHHLAFVDDRFDDYRADSKVNPPLRDARDRDALRAGVLDGTIDAFATDHAPHGLDEKAQLLSAAPVGFTGLEIAVGAYALALPELGLERYVTLLSVNPARILGVPGGSLAVGSAGDVTVFADRPWTVDARLFRSKGKNTPFDGLTLPRRALATVIDGAVVFEHGRVLPREEVPA